MLLAALQPSLANFMPSVKKKRVLQLLCGLLAIAVSLWFVGASVVYSAQPKGFVKGSTAESSVREGLVTWQEQRSWHQHYDAAPLEVAISLITKPGTDDLIPIRISGVWINRSNFNLWRNSPETFTAIIPNIVHGYVNESNPEYVPRFRFVGDTWLTDPQAGNAKQQIISAFAEWSSLQAGKSPVTAQSLNTGLAFRLVEPTPALPNPDAEIELYWQSLNAGMAASTNRTIDSNGRVSQIHLTFNSSNHWWFGTAATTPSEQMHFYSSALHELGHIVGLWESNQLGSVMIYKRNPGPDGPAFDTLDEYSKRVVYALYSMPDEPVSTVKMD